MLLEKNILNEDAINNYISIKEEILRRLKKDGNITILKNIPANLQTLEFYNECVLIDIYSLLYIPDTFITKEMYLVAASKDPNAIRFLKHNTRMRILNELK